MMILDRPKAIVLRVPRCASFTLTQYVMAHYRARSLSRHFADPRYFHLMEIPEGLRSYDLYAVVRNPYGRFLSLWAHLIARGTRLDFSTIRAAVAGKPLFDGPFLPGWFNSQSLCLSMTGKSVRLACCEDLAGTMARWPWVRHDAEELKRLLPRAHPGLLVSVKDFYERHPDWAEFVRGFYEEDFRNFGYDMDLEKCKEVPNLPEAVEIRDASGLIPIYR